MAPQPHSEDPMSGRRPWPAGRGARAALGLLGVALSVACPDPYFYLHPGVSAVAELPSGAARLSVTLTASVPEGDWLLRVSGSGFLAAPAAPSLGSVRDDSVCGVGCAERRYALHCPRGTCDFQVELSAVEPIFETPMLAADFVFESDRGGRCSPNPAYVADADRARLFQLDFETHDVVLRDAGPSFVAIPFDAAALPSDAGWDAGP